MKQIIKSFFFIAVLSLASCNEDFLELEPQQSLSISSAIVDLGSLNAATLGLYSNLQDADIYGWDYPLIGDLRADNVFISSKNSNRYLAFDEYRLNEQSGDAAGQWLDMYAVIVNSSNVINRTGEADILSSEQAEADNRVGEAYALRGLTYWNLVKYFARPYTAENGAGLGVPFNNEGTTGEIVTPSRETIATVYNQIISDLNNAIDRLTLTDDGRMSQAGAQAILAKVYLYQGDWANAEALANQVINNPDYSLYADGQAWLDSWGANIGSEDLFTVINTPTDNLGVNSVGGGYDQDGYGDFLATQDLYDIYSDTDARRDVMIPGDRADGERGTFFPEGKYPNGETGQDYIKVMRLADVYLIRAEARAELGNEDGARADLDAVAGRVDPSYTASTASGQDLIDEILLERRKELAFEGDRVYDLTRRQMSWIKFRTFDSQAVNWNDDQVYNPIPVAEIDNNPNMEQNPGYLQ
ncbi:MAG: RagB/SusD family nutrient uptake outer membrane protein [Bacteroidota bacterium]